MGKVPYIGFILLLLATVAEAGVITRTTAPTQEQAMDLATLAAKKIASKKGTCYKPAWTVNECTAVTGGVTCRADTASEYGSCQKGKHGWLSPGAPHKPPLSFSVPVYPL